MAIKKPIKKPATPAPAASKLKKRAREVEEEPEETEEEEEEEVEETPLQRKKRLREEAEAAKAKAKKKKKKRAEAEEEEPAEEEEENEADTEEGEPEEAEEEPAEEEEEEETPAPRKGSQKKKKKAKRSLADVFDETKPGRGLMPAGDYKMIVKGYEMDGEIAEDPEEQGPLKVKVTYEGHEDEEEGVAGKTISQWYTIADDDGEPGPGIPFLKGDLDVLGYEDVLLADLQEIFDDVEAEEPEVIVKVKQNGQYTNAYLQGLAETEAD